MKKQFRALLGMVIATIMLLQINVPIVEAADSFIAVTVDGVFVSWTDAAPFIDQNNRTMVPLRAVGDALGLVVSWDGAKREAVFSKDGKTLIFPIDSDTARAGDGASVKMDTAAVIVNNRTYAPIRYLAEYFGYKVGWNGASKTVEITAQSANSTTGQNTDVFSFLVAQGKGKGSLNGNSYCYTFNSFQNSGILYNFNLYYSPDKDEITLSLFQYADGHASDMSLYIPRNMKSPYDGTCVFDDNYGSLLIDAKTYTNKGNLYFVQASVPDSLKESFASLYSSGLSFLLDYTERTLLQPNGYSLSNIGFTSFKGGNNSTPNSGSYAPSNGGMTTGEKNATSQAINYLKVLPLSRQGLIEQLEYEGYSHSEAVYGADNCGADWYEQAARKAALYLKTMSFSRQGLIEQLEFEGFTHEQAVYGVGQNGY